MLKKNILILFSLLIAFNQLKSQELKGQIIPAQQTTIYLYGFPYGNPKLLDSVQIDSSGYFRFNISDVYSGIIQLNINNNKFDILHDGNNIEMEINKQTETVKFLQSDANKLYQSYKTEQTLYLKKTNLLLPIVYEYPENDEFRNITIKEIRKLNEAYKKMLTTIKGNNPDNLAISLIRLEQTPIINPELTHIQAFNLLKQNFFKYTNFTDTTILFSPTFNKKIIAYIELFPNRSYTKKQQTEELKQATDNLLSFSSVSPQVYTYMLNYLIKGFTYLGLTDLADYVVEQSDFDHTCKATSIEGEVQQRMELLKSLVVGKNAPNFTFIDQNNKNHELYKLESKYTLLLFWSSNCSHCIKDFPELIEIYNKYHSLGFEIIAISLDNNLDEFYQTILDFDLQWLSTCDTKGWESLIAKQYGIYATPTLFILDASHTIAHKPSNNRDIRKFLKENLGE